MDCLSHNFIVPYHFFVWPHLGPTTQKILAPPLPGAHDPGATRDKWWQQKYMLMNIISYVFGETLTDNVRSS